MGTYVNGLYNPDMNREFSTVEEMLRTIVKCDEYPTTTALMKTLEAVRDRGWFNRDEFVAMGMWKSPRPKQHYLSNEPETVISVSGKALSAPTDREKLTKLIELSGVSLPVATAILTLIYPEKYGVIDIRAWQVFHLYGVLNWREGGKGFSVEDCLAYLEVLRRYAAILNVTPRDIDRSLYIYHKTIQEGTLY